MSHRELDDMLGKGWRKPAFVKNTLLRWSLFAGFFAYLIAAFMTIDVDWGRVYEGLERGCGRFFSRLPARTLFRGGQIFGVAFWRAL